MKPLILLALILPISAVAAPDADAPVTVTSVDDIRALAEIDGDPATLTEEEARKLDLLTQLLGPAPETPVTRDTPEVASR